MARIKNALFSIYFGDQSTAYLKNSLHNYTQQEMMVLPGYKEFCLQNRCENIIILDQVHGNNGFCVREKKDVLLKPYTVRGDYIVSALPKIALAVETADCAPVVLIDVIGGVVSLAHAGWRGALAGVVTHAVGDMLKVGSLIENIQIYFGPAARSCCYQVSRDFLDLFEQSDPNIYFQERNGAAYFDNTLFIAWQLEKLGMARKNILLDYAICTICSEKYCSFRRQGQIALRQMTIVALK
ncbi:MAG: polyphenol oxidase family protein [Candidatus Babeliaceae bacterium]|nr:polyphenol oxidase family protein [Candidatus Babeliaceae bacterium]